MASQANFAKQMHEEFLEFKEKLSSIDANVNKLQTDLTSVQLDIAELRNKTLATATDIHHCEERLDSLEKTIYQDEINKDKSLAEMISEQVRIFGNRKNLILFHDTTTDITEMLEELYKSLEYQGAKPAVEKVGANAYPIRLKFTNVKDRDHMLKSTTKLKGQEKYNKTYLKPDLTYNQRIKHKQCVEELKSLRANNNSKLYQIKNFRVVEKMQH